MKQLMVNFRHSFSLLIALALLGASTLLTQPASAQTLSPGCAFIDGRIGSSGFLGLSFEAGETVSVYIYALIGSPTQGTLAVAGTPVGTTNLPGTVSYTLTSSGTQNLVLLADTGAVSGNWTCGYVATTPSKKVSKAGPLALNLLDGRVNNVQDKDVAAPVAIYNGSLLVYGIDLETGEGSLDVQISESQIEAVGVPTDAPVVLGQGKNAFTGIDIYVYRLPTGEFQVNTHYADGKAYIFLWDADGSKWHQAA